MRHKLLLRSFLVFVIMATFVTQIYASEVTGDLSSLITPSGGSGAGSEVSGTLGEGTIVGDFSGGSSSSGSGGGNSGGSVSGSSTTSSGGNPNTPTGQVLGTSTNVPGFPTTGTGLLDTYLDFTLVILILTMLLLASYSAYKTPKQIRS